MRTRNNYDDRYQTVRVAGMFILPFLIIAIFLLVISQHSQTQISTKNTKSNKSIATTTGSSIQTAKHECRNLANTIANSQKRNILEYKFIPGRRLTEQFQYLQKNSYLLRGGIKDKLNQNKIRTELSCIGGLKITCYQKMGRKSFIGYKMENPLITFAENDKPASYLSELRKDFLREVYFEQDSLGNILSIYFPQIHTIVKNFWQQILFIRVCHLSKAKKVSWISKGENTIGSYVAMYRNKRVSKQISLVTRSLKKYITLKYIDSNENIKDNSFARLNYRHFQMKDLVSKASYRFDRKLGKPREITFNEKGALCLKQQFAMEASYQTSWHSSLESTTTSNAGQLLKNLLSLYNITSLKQLKQKLNTSVLGKPERMVKSYTEKQKKDAHANFLAVLDKIQNLFSAGQFDSIKLSTLFRQANKLVQINPEILKVILSKLQARNSLEVKGFLTDILAHLGTDEAQKMLIKSLSNSSSDTKFHNRIMFSTMFVKHPNTSFRKNMLDIFQIAPQNSALKRLSLRNIGAIAHKFKDSNDKVAKQMLRYIIEYKQKAVTISQKLALIDALGNTHMADSAKEIQYYLQPIQAQRIRNTAIAALARFELDSTLQIVNQELPRATIHMVESALRCYRQKNWKKHSSSAKKQTLWSLRNLRLLYPQNKTIQKLIQDILSEIQ